MIKILKYSLLFLFVLGTGKAFSQNIGDVEVVNSANYDPVIKEAVKQTDRPEITDTVRKITKVTYTSPGKVYATSYQSIPIEPAKMVNEPLSKLYQSLIKVGIGNYTMPYGELFFNNLRSKESTWGLRYKHLSSHAKFTGMGYTDFSDNEGSVYGKKFYKKETLSGDFNYSRNVVHYYGFSDTAFSNIHTDNYKQRFQLFEGKVRLQSHKPDSAGTNHDVHFNYSNYGDLYKTYENNIFADALIGTLIQKQKFNFLLSEDYYSVHSAHDTVKNSITRAGFFVEEGNGSKWKADVGAAVAIDHFAKTGTNFYPYYRLNVYYNVYQNIVIPYAGVTGGVEKNSFRSLSTLNPFVLSDLSYQNTYNKITGFGGLRGALSSNTSYDVKASYGVYNKMAFYMVDYNQRSVDNVFGNKYKISYMNTDLLTVTAQIKYQFREKLNISAKGNYYGYTLKDTTKVYPWHKPNYDITLSANYNLKSKLIFKADIFAIGNQWAQQQINTNGVITQKAVQLNGIVDINIGAEYRYTKMLSAFVSFNNIGNFRYYRWDQYPTQKFNCMFGLTFVPF
ncbi:MAG: hypothetical protein ACXVPN_06540 [Bacteroidia bacterium]